MQTLLPWPLHQALARIACNLPSVQSGSTGLRPSIFIIVVNSIEDKFNKSLVYLCVCVLFSYGKLPLKYESIFGLAGCFSNGGGGEGRVLVQ